MSNTHHSTQPESVRSNNIPDAQPVPLSKSSKGRWRLRPPKGLNKGPSISNGIPDLQNGHDKRIEITDEKSDLLGEILFSGVLVPDGKKSNAKAEAAEVTARLTTKQFAWATSSLSLDDIVAVSYHDGSRRFTIHSFVFVKSNWLPSTFTKPCRKRKDMHFLASNPEDLLKWVSAFAAQKCYVNCLPHPLSSSKKQGSISDARDSPPSFPGNDRPGKTMLVILNPRSGRGRARKVFDSKAEPIFKLAGFRLKVLETSGPNHAYKLAATMDLSLCPDGIICVGGDGIINEVLNGLLSREDDKQSSRVPIGIIPAGSDNSLIWTVLGIQDPVSAAVSIVKGGLVALDVFAVEWIKTGDLHMGLTIAYYGFMSDVLEHSEKYQKRFGPLRYFVAGALKLLCLPRYECEVEYLPTEASACPENPDAKKGHVEIALDTANGDCFDRKADIEAGPRVLGNGMGSHDLIATSRVSGELDLAAGALDANNEPSEYVRGLEGKTKRLPVTRSSTQSGHEEALALHHILSGATTPSPRPRTRSKSRIDRGWSGLSSANGSTRSSWDYSVMDSNGESPDDGSNSVSVDTSSEAEHQGQTPIKHSRQTSDEDNWVVKQGPFLGVMICNHKCRTVQCLQSQVLAPTAEYDDNALDLIMVRWAGRLQLLRFFFLVQFGRHLSLPFVEYTKVRSVKLKPGTNSHKGCGIDGELLPLNGPISLYLLAEQCRLIGRTRSSS